MNREDAIKIIEDFNKAGGRIFIDGCKGKMSDKDLIGLAKDCLFLLQQHNDDEVKP